MTNSWRKIALQWLKNKWNGNSNKYHFTLIWVSIIHCCQNSGDLTDAEDLRAPSEKIWLSLPINYKIILLWKIHFWLALLHSQSSRKVPGLVPNTPAFLYVLRHWQLSPILHGLMLGQQLIIVATIFPSWHGLKLLQNWSWLVTANTGPSKKWRWLLG